MMRRRTFLTLGAGGALGVAACAGRRAMPLADGVAEAEYPPLGKLIDVDGLKVHAAETGSGGPPVILLHGANVNLRDWTFSLTEPLSQDRRVIAMDRPGFGYSERGPGDWTPARQAEQLRAAAKIMGIERPIIVGHSWGAAVALAWALDAPEDVSGVVSVSGALMPWGVGVGIANALGIGRLGVDYYMASLSRDEEAVDRFVSRAFRPQSPPEGYLDYVGAPLSLRAGSMEANSDDLVTLHPSLVEASRRYASLDIPVEVVHGELDWLLTVERHVEGFAARVPQANIAVAKGVGHMSHHARPDLIAAAIDRDCGCIGMNSELTSIPLDRDTLMAFMRLKVAASQTTFVSSNSETIAEACFADGTTLGGLCWNDEPAGLYSVINPKLAKNDPHSFQPDCAFLWRFMVDEGFQGKGLGALALTLIFDTAIADGFTGLTLTAVDGEPGCPLPFYRKQGFEPDRSDAVRRGRVDETDRCVTRDLIVDRRGLAQFAGRLIPCAIGHGGITHDKREGDGGTPVGVWRMESVHYRADRIAPPETALPVSAIGPRDGWCDDQTEAVYNQPMPLPATCSHERMRRGDGLYDIVVVLDHNRHPPEPGKGSAIFVHCWRAPRFPTAGCLAFTPHDLRWILARWGCAAEHSSDPLISFRKEP